MRQEPGDRHDGSESAGRKADSHPPGGRDDDRKLLDHLRRQRQGRLVKAIVALALVVLLIVFIIANSQPVKVNFVVLSRHPRLIWVMLACAVFGGIAGYLIGRPGRQLRFGRHGRDEDQPGDRGT
jgi:uncharacterized integral membrane protein